MASVLQLSIRWHPSKLQKIVASMSQTFFHLSNFPPLRIKSSHELVICTDSTMTLTATWSYRVNPRKIKFSTGGISWLIVKYQFSGIQDWRAISESVFRTDINKYWRTMETESCHAGNGWRTDPRFTETRSNIEYTVVWHSCRPKLPHSRRQWTFIRTSHSVTQATSKYFKIIPRSCSQQTLHGLV